MVNTQHAKPVLNVRAEISLKIYAVMLLIQWLMRDVTIVSHSVSGDRVHLQWGDFGPFHIR